MKIRHFLGLITCVGLGACATAAHTMLNGAHPAAARTSPEDIAIYTAPPARTHTQIALLSLDALEDSYLSLTRADKAAIEALRGKASSLGADAILLQQRALSDAHAITTGDTTSFSSYGTAGTMWGAGSATARRSATTVYAHGSGSGAFNSQTPGTTTTNTMGVTQQSKRVGYSAIAIRFS